MSQLLEENVSLKCILEKILVIPKQTLRQFIIKVYISDDACTRNKYATLALHIF